MNQAVFENHHFGEVLYDDATPYEPPAPPTL
jgi:hypothetical protein